jgi:hypothetical protein
MFQNRSGVAHATIMVLMAGGQRPAAGLHLLPRATHLALSSPLSLPSGLPSLSSISLRQFELARRACGVANVR